MAQRVSWKGEERSSEQSDEIEKLPSNASSPSQPHRRHSKSSSMSHPPRPAISISPDCTPSPDNSGGSLEGSASEVSSEEETEPVVTMTEAPKSLQDLGRAQSLPVALATSLPTSNILATSPTFSPQNVQRFTTIASGHSDFFKLGDDKLAKPCNPHEAKVYAALANCTPLHPFLAKFYGFMAPPTDSHLSVKSHGKQDAIIVLQDLTYGFTHPCVMDLKMGTSQSTRSQSAAKKKWRSAKVNATTSAKLGVRLGGIRVYKPYLKEWVVRKGNYGKRLTEATFMDALNLFFNDGRRTRLELIGCFVERLKEFLTAMEAARPDFDFIASSILLIYEGNYDRSSLREKHLSVDLILIMRVMKEPPRCEVRLIDFDHTVIKADVPGSKNDDSGAAVGIRNLIHTLDTLLFSHTRTHSFTELPTVKFTGVVQEVKKVPDSDEKLLKLMPAHPKKEFPRLRRVNSQP